MPLHLGSIVVQASGALTADIEDEVVIMAPTVEQYVALEAIGKQIWSQIATPCRIGTICDALAAEYDASRATIENDVLEFLEPLLAAGLVFCV